MEEASKRPRLDAYSSSDHESDAAEESKKNTFALPLAVKREMVKEDPLPDPFPLPSNYRADVEIGLKSGIMSKEARGTFSQVWLQVCSNIKRSPQERSIQELRSIISLGY